MNGQRGWMAAAGALVLSLLTACASVTQGTEQDIRVDTLTQDGRTIDDAECALVNEKGRTLMRSGTTRPVRRAGGDLDIRCRAPGQPPAHGQAISRANAGLAGNLLIGGAIGAAVDVGTGAAYTYPVWVRLVFGEERLFDRSGNRHDGPVAGTLLRQTGAAADPATTVAAMPPPATQAPSAAAAAAAAADTRLPISAVLRRGDVLEYVLTDRMTGRSTPVLYRLDRIEGDQLVFNMGSRVERQNGQIVSAEGGPGGLFDAVAPAQGWAHGDLQPGMAWSVEQPQYRLRARVQDQSVTEIEGEQVPVVRIDYSVWYAPPGSSSTATLRPLEAKALYAPSLRRVVEFEAEMRTPASLTQETLRLRRILR